MSYSFAKVHDHDHCSIYPLKCNFYPVLGCKHTRLKLSASKVLFTVSYSLPPLPPSRPFSLPPPPSFPSPLSLPKYEALSNRGAFQPTLRQAFLSLSYFMRLLSKPYISSLHQKKTWRCGPMLQV